MALRAIAQAAAVDTVTAAAPFAHLIPPQRDGSFQANVTAFLVIPELAVTMPEWTVAIPEHNRESPLTFAMNFGQKFCLYQYSLATGVEDRTKHFY